MTGWFKFVLINYVLKHCALATDIDGSGQTEQTLKVLQGTAEDLKDSALIQKQRYEYLELKLLENREELKQLKIQYDRNIHELEARVRELEVAAMNRDRQVITLKQEKEEDREYIHKVEERLAKLEKKFKNACQLRNCSTNLVSENTPSPKNDRGKRIQSKDYFL
ncbi:uncharacterized protein LOC130046590 [Ostrea edulis]|uniref:uncharacterized protein LOC130046590 n=1 Tax=Ostrea edulis TaxID=37623 RepID=UPI0024AF5720|nr:uncharacterized protein LOC130046590 [Ostrea edulis]